MFLSIGGMNSHARLATDVLLRMQMEEQVTDVKSSLSVRSDEYTMPKETPKYYVLTKETVTLALKRICDKEDNELEMYSMYPNAEPAAAFGPEVPSEHIWGTPDKALAFMIEYSLVAWCT